MKHLPNTWVSYHTCTFCKGYLVINANDLRCNADGVYISCPICGNKQGVFEVPEYLQQRLMDLYNKKIS